MTKAPVWGFSIAARLLLMHARTWLSALSLPMVAAFTYPVLIKQGTAPKASAKPNSNDPLEGLSDIQDVLALVQANYVDAPDMEKVLGGGIQSALERAHPMNALLTPADLRLPDPGPAEIGARILKRGLYAQVLAVTPGSPAAKTGLLPGDVIRKIDGESVGAMSSWTLERHLRGAEGSSVSLSRYSGTSADLSKITVTRERLKPSTLSVKKSDAGALIALSDLQSGRAVELKGLLGGLDKSKPLVLDLRSNFRGELNEASSVASLFTNGGTLVTLQEAGKPDRALALNASTPNVFSKLVVLQNASTVGAAEALSSCLKKAGAKVVGERSYGLGVERSRFPLRQGGAVELVNKRWVGAGGEKLDRQGVTPDHTLRGLTTDEDVLPKVIAALAKPEAPKPTKAS
jgi:carboxyl-terminal processing protease